MLEGVKNILFDLGGVLFHIDYQRTIDVFKKLGINNFEKYFSQNQQKDLFDAFETGKITSEVFISSLKKSIPHCTEQQIIDGWNAMLIGGLNQRHLNLLELLGKNYRLFLLSNTNLIHLHCVNEYLQKNLNLLSINQYFEKVYYSQEIGRRKPHKSTFEWVLKDSGIIANETLFIDDTAQHIEGARRAGLKTHFFKRNSELTLLFPDITL